MTTEQIDRQLATLREAWLDARPEKQGAWLEKINQLLDERLKSASPNNSDQP